MQKEDEIIARNKTVIVVFLLLQRMNHYGGVTFLHQNPYLIERLAGH